MKPNWLIRIVSFIYPVRLHRTASAFNPVLDIVIYQGKIQLNSKTANYSFGPLHDVMERTLTNVVKIHKCRFEKVLLLGYGGGSVSQIVHQKYNPQAKITAVEIDPEVIKLANNWFFQKKVNLVCSDAAAFIEKSTEQWEVIIADIFIDKLVPSYFTTDAFYRQIENKLKPGGIFIQNTILETNSAEKQFSIFKNTFPKAGQLRFYGFNYVFVGKK